MSYICYAVTNYTYIEIYILKPEKCVRRLINVNARSEINYYVHSSEKLEQNRKFRHNHRLNII
jgi:hypothetical protein